MSISSGYDKYKEYRPQEDGSHKLASRWTSSHTVEFDDGKNAEEKFAEIGTTDLIYDEADRTLTIESIGKTSDSESSFEITDSLETEDSNIALSATAGKNLQDQINLIEDNISNIDNNVLGNTDISDIADGTVKGAIRNLADNPADLSVWISSSEYDSLSDEEKDSDTTYYIYDAESNDNAFTVPFESEQFEAENVGDALNEVNSNLDNFKVQNSPLSISLGSLTADTRTSFNCNWQNYMFLWITIGSYQNVYSDMFVPVDAYFKNTNDGSRLILYNPAGDNCYVEIYQNGEGSIEIRPNSVAASRTTDTITVYGIMYK